MIKPFHENKTELSIDKSKVQSLDILPTLLWMACGEKADLSDFEGLTPNNIPHDSVRKIYRYNYNHNLPPADPDLERSYPGFRGVEEYFYTDLKSLEFGTKSESFVRITPLIKTYNKDK